MDAEASAVEVEYFRAHPITAGEEIHVPFRWIASEPQAHQRAQAIEALCACRWARRTRTPSLGGHGTIATAAAAARRRRCRGLPRADLRLFSSVLCKLVILYDDAAAIRTRNNELPAERARVEVLLTDWQKLAKRGDVDAVILSRHDTVSGCETEPGVGNAQVRREIRRVHCSSSVDVYTRGIGKSARQHEVPCLSPPGLTRARTGTISVK